MNSIKITTLTTERHVQIRSFLRREYPEILHQFDVWHFPKSVKKALSEIARKRDCEQVKTIINRLWWCCASLIGNEKLIKEQWLSMWNHIPVFTLGKIINYFTNVNTDNWTTRRIKSPNSELICSAFFQIFPHSDWIRTSYSVRMRENPGKMRTRKTPNTDSSYAVQRTEMARNRFTIVFSFKNCGRK